MLIKTKSIHTFPKQLPPKMPFTDLRVKGMISID